MDTSANPVGRWSIIVALAITILMVVYFAGFNGDGKVAFGMAIISWTVAAFIYLLYARINSVQRAGFMSLVFVLFIAFLLPLYFLAQPHLNAETATQQYQSKLQYAAGKFATYCSQCHGLLGQGINGPALNAKYGAGKALEALTSTDLTRIITAGIPDPTNPAQYLMPDWGQDYGGPLNGDDINDLVMLIQSSDSVLQAKNGVPTSTNGFDLVLSTLTPDQVVLYNQQLANIAKPPGTATDLTALTAVTVPIINTPQASNALWNFDYTDQATGAISRVIKVKVGTKITWVNNSSVAHSIHSGSPISGDTNVFLDPIINPGATFEWTATAAGDYQYYCSFHPAMTAEIIVVP